MPTNLPVIDDAQVQAMVESALETLAGADLFVQHLGGPPADEGSQAAKATAALVSMTISPRSRGLADNANAADKADVKLLVVCASPAPQQDGSVYACATAAARVAKLFTGATFYDNADPSLHEHSLQCLSCEREHAAMEHGETVARTATVTVHALATRRSGTTTTDHLT